MERQTDFRGDSLSVFCSSTKGKRGYFNRFTGEVAVPAQYEKAWIFSEGMACVLDKGMLHFIDHKGQPLMGKEFPY
ncbi:MAG: WG repeat-containing protein, partial [Bacteroidales bacterium]|nr:WG repeat-containing protein [Bacteroidales bacterium]